MTRSKTMMTCSLEFVQQTYQCKFLEMLHHCLRIFSRLRIVSTFCKEKFNFELARKWFRIDVVVLTELTFSKGSKSPRWHQNNECHILTGHRWLYLTGKIRYFEYHFQIRMIEYGFLKNNVEAEKLGPSKKLTVTFWGKSEPPISLIYHHFSGNLWFLCSENMHKFRWG